jgi:RimJ/RimL family protein N-acetyltransferase
MGAIPVTEDDLRDELGDPQNVEFAIMAGQITPSRFIGIVGLYGINWLARNAEFRIFIGSIGERSKGYGTEATKQVVDYSFATLNLNKVWLGVNEQHKNAIRVYEKVGFIHEGTLRQAIYRNGRYFNAIRMSILREEWENHTE